MKPEVTLFMAMSLNGQIARKNDSEDFLSHYGWEYFCKLAEQSGAFIIGRNTYEIVKKNYEGYGFDYIEKVIKIIVTSNKDYKVKGYHIAHTPFDALAILESLNSHKVILSGGSTLNTSFAKSDLIDKIVLNMEPVIIENGISVFNDKLDLKLELEETESYENDGITFKYDVVKQ